MAVIDILTCCLFFILSHYDKYPDTILPVEPRTFNTFKDSVCFVLQKDSP